MALVERLMAIEIPRIPVHFFYAANQQRIEGKLTRQEVINMFQLDAAATAEYDAIAALAPTGTTALALAQKAMFVDEMHSVFLLGEGRFIGYSTPNEVRAKIGLAPQTRVVKDGPVL